MIGVLLLFLALMGAACAPDTWLGARLRTTLIDEPARLLNDRPSVLLLRLAVTVAVVAFIVGAPEIAALVNVADLTAFMELTAAACLLGAVSVIRAAVRGGRAAAALAAQALPVPARARVRARSPRIRRPRRAAPPSDDHVPWTALQPA